MPKAYVPAQPKLHRSRRKNLPDDRHPAGHARVLSPLDLASSSLGEWGRWMPVRANVLGVRHHRYRNAWAIPGDRYCDLASPALPPVLPRRARSSPNLLQKRGPFFGGSITESEQNRRFVQHFGTYATQAINIERAVRQPPRKQTLQYGKAETVRHSSTTGKPFARNSQS